VMGTNPSHFQGDLRLPVDRVSPSSCREFCEKTGMELPDEIYWELACRAGTTTAYSFGNDVTLLENYGWYVKNSGEKTHVVGEKLANAWGLHDMLGNLWELCKNTYSKDLGYRVVRGGSWHNSERHCRSTSRTMDAPPYSGYDLGFRIWRPV